MITEDVTITSTGRKRASAQTTGDGDNPKGPSNSACHADI